MLKRFAILIACMLPFIGMGDVLWWAINDSYTAQVHDGETTSTLYEFLVPMPYDGAPDYNDVYGARIAVKDYSGNVITYLNQYYQTNPEETNPMYFHYEIDPDVNEADIGHPNEGSVGVAWAAADVSREMLQERIFQIELGHSTWNDSIGDYQWRTIAYSDNYTGQSLIDSNSYVPGSIAPPTELPWEPIDFYTYNPPIVPEPSTGLLFLVGASLLALKRKHRAWHHGSC